MLASSPVPGGEGVETLRAVRVRLQPIAQKRESNTLLRLAEATLDAEADHGALHAEGLAQGQLEGERPGLAVEGLGDTLVASAAVRGIVDGGHALHPVVKEVRKSRRRLRLAEVRTQEHHALLRDHRVPKGAVAHRTKSTGL